MVQVGVELESDAGSVPAPPTAEMTSVPRISRSLSSTLPPMPTFDSGHDDHMDSPASVMAGLFSRSEEHLPRAKSLERDVPVARSLERSSSWVLRRSASLALYRSRSIKAGTPLSRSWTRGRLSKKSEKSGNETPTPETLSETLAVLGSNPNDSTIVQSACDRLRVLAREGTSNWSAIRAGAVEAVVEGIKGHTDDLDVQQEGFLALRNLTREADLVAAVPDAEVYRQAVTAVVAGMKAHPSSVGLQEHGAAIIASLCGGDSKAAADCRQLAVEAGVLPLLVSALQGEGRGNAGIQVCCCRSIIALFRHKSMGMALQARASRAGVVPAVAHVFKHPANNEAYAAARLALRCLVSSSAPMKREAHKCFGGSFSYMVATKM